MARYIKANPKVAKFLHLENDRLQLKDGNYILWQGDMIAFGPLPMLADTLQQIGGIALLPNEAKQEQDGTLNRPLPIATDERFVVEEANAEIQETDPKSQENTVEVKNEDVEEKPEEPSEETTEQSKTNDAESETATLEVKAKTTSTRIKKK